MNKCAFPEEITRLLLQHRFGVLATYGGEYPYTSLISIAFIHGFRQLVFPTLRETRKYSNLLHEDRVSVLLDNRSSFDKEPKNVYALTILGSAGEEKGPLRLVLQEQFLLHHPHLSDFLSLPQTALIQVTFTKFILVEEFQKIREFDCLQT